MKYQLQKEINGQWIGFAGLVDDADCQWAWEILHGERPEYEGKFRLVDQEGREVTGRCLIAPVLYEISATRSDGLRCYATIEAQDAAAASRECRKVFRTFKVSRHGITSCQIHGGQTCVRHTGQRMTFSDHAYRLGQSLREVR